MPKLYASAAKSKPLSMTKLSTSKLSNTSPMQFKIVFISNSRNIELSRLDLLKARCDRSKRYVKLYLS